MLRVGLFDAAGHMSALASRPEPFSGAAGDAIDPEVWWKAFQDACAELSGALPTAFAAVKAIAITGATRCQVWLDEAGHSIRPALGFTDARAAPLIGELRELLPPEHAESGEVNAFHPLARMYWLKREEPKAFARLSMVADPKDFLNLRLTGRIASDPIACARLAAAARLGPHGASLFDATALSSGLLPPLLPPARGWEW